MARPSISTLRHTNQQVVDLCAYLDEDDRTELDRLGFKHLQGDHFLYTFRDGEKWPVKFPDSVVDGNVMLISLDVDEVLTVISTEYVSNARTN